MRSISSVILLLIISISLMAAQNNKNTPANPAPKKQQIQLTISFSAEGDRTWWLVDERNQPLNVPQSFKDKKTVVEIPSDTKGASLLFEDKKTGNMAVYPTTKLAGKKDLSVSNEDFKYASRIQVKLTKDNKPAYNVTVRLKDSSGLPPRSVVVSSTNPGVANFEHVSFGKVTIEVMRADGNKDTHEETLKATRPEPVAIFNYPITADVPTAEIVAAAQQTPSKPASRPSGGGPGSIILYLLSLAIAIAVLIGVLKLIQGKNQKVTEFMQKLGIQLPEPATTATTGTIGASGAPIPVQPVVPEGFCQFCGQKFGADGSCACTLSGTTPGMSTASSTGKPRLFGLQGSYAGTSFDLNDDLVTIGREPGNTVTLNNDSTISRRHAQLARQAGAYTLTDFESSNGTFVNDVKITGECVVRPGDTVQFGMSKFKLEG